MKITKQKLQSAIDVLKHVSDEIKLVFKPDGVHILTYDKCHVSLLSVVLKKETFEEYKPEGLEIVVDLVKLKEFLRLYKNPDILTFDYNEETNRLIARNGFLTRTFGLLDPEGFLEPKVPKLTLTKKVIINTDTFLKTIDRVVPKDKKRCINTIKLSVISEGLRVADHNEIDDVEKPEETIPKDALLMVVSKDAKQSLYDCDILRPMLRQIKRILKEVSLEFDRNTPIVISGETPNISIRYIVAPRIENEKEIEEPEPVSEDHDIAVKPEPEISEQIQEPIAPQVPLEEPIVAVKPEVLPEKMPSKEPFSREPMHPETPERPIEPMIAIQRDPMSDIGWLASPRDDMHEVGEIIAVTKIGYLLLFRGSKKHREPVEYERDLIEVYRRE